MLGFFGFLLARALLLLFLFQLLLLLRMLLLLLLCLLLMLLHPLFLCLICLSCSSLGALSFWLLLQSLALLFLLCAQQLQLYFQGPIHKESGYQPASFRERTSFFT
jgi:hypothetical protein